MKITIIGAGKVGRSWAQALRGTCHTVRLFAARAGLPAQRVTDALLILAVRDGQVAEWAQRLAEAAWVSRRTAVVHVAGALGTSPLEPLRGCAAGLGRAHPAVSFPSSRWTPGLLGASLLVAGDAVAVRRASTAGRAVGLVPRVGDEVDPVTYHAACALAANGGAAIAAAACRLLVQSGLPVEIAPAVVGPLLRSVGENVLQLGLPVALSGPVRRGDAGTVRRHLGRLRAQTPDLVPLYRELGRVQLALARELAEALPKDLDAVESALRGRS